MEGIVYSNESIYERQLNQGQNRWEVPPVMDEMKPKTEEKGLWNLFLPDSEYNAQLSYLEYAPLCEIMGRSPIAPEVFNCSAPYTGNMEVLTRYGSSEQKEKWLRFLLHGDICSYFFMTKLTVALKMQQIWRGRIEKYAALRYLRTEMIVVRCERPVCNISIFMN